MRLTPCAMSAKRIIGKLTEGAAAGGQMLGHPIGEDADGRPPTLAMTRFADSLARQKRIKPPPGYKTSISICREFLNRHAPKKAGGEAPGKLDPKTVSPSKITLAEKTAQENDASIFEDVATGSTAISEQIDTNVGTKRRKRNLKTTNKPRKSTAPISAEARERSGRHQADATATPPTAARQHLETVTPLQIPYGNKRSRSEPWRPLWLVRMVCSARC